jgi:ATP-binding cassette subfamily C protein
MRENQLEFQHKNGVYQVLFGVISAALLCLFIYVGVEVVSLEFSLLAMLLVIATRLLPLISELQSQYQRLLNNLPALAEIQQALAANIANAEPVEKAPIVLPKQSICLAQVGFSYTAEKAILTETTIRLPVGEISALQGVSGGGKTTIADLFAGLLTPDVGYLCLDDQRLSPSQTLTWRDKVTYLAQEPFLFDGTIKDNICWGLNLTDDEIWALLAAVSADFVKDRPAGIYAQVGDRGLLLSGGQRQRIILARALARQSALLILDEATNALDPETELTILNLLKNMKGKMTILIIGHQNDLSHVADNIVIVKKHH